MKFAADCMLGKLAKWLRILGFDVLYFSKIEDGKLLNLARKENRALLTRDHELLGKAKALQGLLIRSEKWEEQVVQVLDSFNLRSEARPHSRCLECNQPLKALSMGNARNLVSPFVLDHAEEFSLCPACGRVYWKGTHSADMERKLQDFLDRRKI